MQTRRSPPPTADARHGLDLLGKLQKPQGVSDGHFQQGVKEFRVGIQQLHRVCGVAKEGLPKCHHFLEGGDG